MLNLIIGQSSDFIYTCNLHFQQMIKHLLALPQFVQLSASVLENLTKNEIVHLLKTKFSQLPNNILFYEELPLHIPFPDECKLILIIDDLHHQGAVAKKRRLQLQKVDKVLATYGYCFRQYYHTTATIYFFPHASCAIRPFNDCPIAKICVSGRLNDQIYPIRQRFYQMCQTSNQCIYLPVNCRYVITNDNDTLIYGHRYVHTLGNYLACITCDVSANRPYIVAKHFEILASGSLLLAHNTHTQPYFKTLGLIDKKNYLMINDQNMQETIDWVLNPANKIAVTNIRMAGYQLALAYHSVQARVDYLMDILNNENGVYCTNGLANTCYYAPNVPSNKF